MATFTQIALIITYFIISTSLSVSNALYPQYIQTYPHQSCIGPPSSLLVTNGDVQGTGEEGLKSCRSMSDRGLWRLTFVDGMVSTRSFTKGDRSCWSYTINGSTHMELASAVNLLPYHLEESSLIIFFEEFFRGQYRLMDPGTIGIGFKPGFIRSWALTGIREFAVYNEIDFNGNVTCLKPTEQDIQDGWGMSVEWGIGEPIFAGSVLRYCPEKVDRVLYGSPQRRAITVDKNGNEIQLFVENPVTVQYYNSN